MSWLKIDDGYDDHPKLLELTELERWRWTRVLIHCAKHDTHGAVRPGLLKDLGLHRAAAKLVRLELLEPAGDGYLVHDWRIYNGATIEEKVAAVLTKNPDATANEICKEVGGKRELVLAVISSQRSQKPGSQVVPDPVPGNQQSGSAEPPEVVPDRYPSGSRARAPVPRPEPEASEGSTVNEKVQVQVKTPSNGARPPTPDPPTWADDDLDLTPIGPTIEVARTRPPLEPRESAQAPRT